MLTQALQADHYRVPLPVALSDSTVGSAGAAVRAVLTHDLAHAFTAARPSVSGGSLTTGRRPSGGPWLAVTVFMVAEAYHGPARRVSRADAPAAQSARRSAGERVRGAAR
ncbi:MAG: hypothetical protein ACREKB_04935, partial [Candidatus Rokuibacteriota bacterium]